MTEKEKRRRKRTKLEPTVYQVMIITKTNEFGNMVISDTPDRKHSKSSRSWTQKRYQRTTKSQAAMNMRKPQIAAAFTTKCCQSPSLSLAKDATKRKPRSTRSPFPTTLKETKTNRPTTTHQEARNHNAQGNQKRIETKGLNLGTPTQLRQGTRVSNLPPASILDLAGSASREPLKETLIGAPLPSSSSSSAFSTRTIDLRCDDQWGEAFGLPPQLSAASLSTPPIRSLTSLRPNRLVHFFGLFSLTYICKH